jgi:hypothetical protein
LEPEILKEKIKLAMAKWNLQEVDTEAYGLVVDTTEQFVHQLVVDLIQQARIRMQESQPNVIQAKARDKILVSTSTYTVEDMRKNQCTFEPRAATPLEYIC